MDFPAFATEINDALIAENGPRLAFLLQPTSPHGRDLAKAYKNPNHRNKLSQYKGQIEAPWDDIAIRYVQICVHLAKNQPEEAFKEHNQLANSFFRFFSENTGWTLPLLFSLFRDLRDLAFDADLEARKSGKKAAESMEDAARTISKAFNICIMDRTSPPEQSRKWGVYYVVSLLLKSYFRIRRVGLSKNILRVFEVADDIPLLTNYPRSHQVTYRYYLGMYNYLNEDYDKSESELTLAFYNCHLKYHNNLQRILTYLIPLRILRGIFPSEELLSQFPILQELYKPFITAIRKGDLPAYDRALEEGERRLVELSLWFNLERARELCLRGLFRKVWVVMGKPTRVPISTLHAALVVSGVDMPIEEAECLVANMIYKGYMRGYVSHEKQMIVLAQQNTFPKVADAPVAVQLGMGNL